MISIVIPHYNSSEVLTETIHMVLLSAAQEDVRIEILVVDDGSAEQHRSRVSRLGSESVKVLFSEMNLGRSGAVNLGVSATIHDLVLILDCDCQPGSAGFFSTHLEAIADADISLGGLLKLQNDFWGNYQDLAVNRRVRQFSAGMPFSFTTQNVLVRKSVFQSVGGYDETYRHYGFEDRDLLLRLQDAGARFAYLPGSSVVHCDSRISLTSVARKMHEAGRHTSMIFSTRHPSAYRSLGYSLIDANLHPALGLAGVPTARIADWLGKWVDPWLNTMPFPLGTALTRAISAMAYLGGTAEAARDRTSR